jgi:hypothetical protein
MFKNLLRRYPKTRAVFKSQTMRIYVVSLGKHMHHYVIEVRPGSAISYVVPSTGHFQSVQLATSAALTKIGQSVEEKRG